MSKLHIPVVIAAKRQEAKDIVSIDLAPARSGFLPHAEAGAHIDVHLPGGLVRQYSLCNDPKNPDVYRIAVLRDPNSRGGSKAVHELQVGEKLSIGVPRNGFRLTPESADITLLAGGVGITPLLAMAYALHRKKRAFTLHYCARSDESMAFRRELLNSDFSENVHLYFSAPSPSRRLDIPVAIGAHSVGRHIYACGPSRFLDQVTSDARDLGWPQEAVHVERFSASVETHGPKFSVVAARSGITVEIAEGQTIAHALEEAGVEVLVSCEQGVCGTCKTAVLEGIPDHRDSYLSNRQKDANDCMMICCSRAKSPKIVLDI